MSLTLQVLHVDGRTSRWALDELDTADMPVDLRFSTVIPGGFNECSCSLFRDVDIIRPDEALADTVQILDGTSVVWEGRMTAFPRQMQDGQTTVTPSAEGWVAHLRDMNRYRMIYRDIDLSRWGGLSIARGSALLTAGSALNDGTTGWQSNGTAAIKTAVDGGGTWSAGMRPRTEAWYNANGTSIGSVAYSWTKNANVDNANTNWFWAVYTSANDALSGSYDGGTNLRAAGPTTGAVLTASTGMKYAAFALGYNAAGGGDGYEYAISWSDIAVYGNHGLTKRGTEPAAGFYGSDVIAHALPLTAPLLNFTTGQDGSIEPSTVILTQLAFMEPVNAEDVVKKVNAVSLRDYAVWENRTFSWTTPDPDRLTWKARLADGAEPALDGLSLADVYTSVIVQFNDPAGVSKTAGPVGSGCDYEDASLGITDADAETNPASVHGFVKDAALTLSDVSTSDYAIAVGAIFLTERGQRTRRGQVILTGQVEHPTAGLMDVHWVRAGQYVDLVDTSDNSLGGARRIIATDMDYATRSNTLTLDNTAFTLEALLAILGAELGN